MLRRTFLAMVAATPAIARLAGELGRGKSSPTMTPAEIRFKRAVVALVRRGIYPSPTALGRELKRPAMIRAHEIGGRETRWRREVLRALGWKERARPHRSRHSWIKPPAL